MQTIVLGHYEKKKQAWDWTFNAEQLLRSAIWKYRENSS